MLCVVAGWVSRWFTVPTSDREFFVTTSMDTRCPQSRSFFEKRAWKRIVSELPSFWPSFGKQDPGRRFGSGRLSKITAEIKGAVKEQMRLDDETTAHQLHKLLTSKGHSISLHTILQCHTSLGWTFRESCYCQLIRHPNKLKRFEWAKNNPYSDEAFENVIFTDECT